MEATLIATALIEASCCESIAATMRELPNGAVRSRGYAGNTHMGVMVWTGKTLYLFLARVRSLGRWDKGTNSQC